jgi:hypothetical protein
LPGRGGNPRMVMRPYHILISAILLAGVFFCGAAAHSGTEKTIDELADGIIRASSLEGAKQAYLPIVGKTSHAANLLSLPNGDLLCFWFTGADEGSSGISIAMSRLIDGSSKWSYPVILSEHPGWSDQNPVPFDAQTTAIVYVLTSNDLGHTWSVPVVLFSQPGTFVRQHLVVFHHEWLFPTYHSASFGITSNAQNDTSVVKISKDNGKIWTGCEVPGSAGLVQMNIVKLSRDQLVAFFRSRYADWIYKSGSVCRWMPMDASHCYAIAEQQCVRRAWQTPHSCAQYPVGSALSRRGPNLALGEGCGGSRRCNDRSAGRRFRILLSLGDAIARR